VSASLIVDLGNTANMGNVQSLPGPVVISPSGQLCGLSGLLVGASIDLLHADTFCNLVVAGTPVLVSGPLVIGVQCSDVDTSGTFTDPTSGLAQLPTIFSSGGFVILGSGSSGGIFGPPVSGQCMMSGFFQAAGFQRPQRFVRATFGGLTSFFVGDLNVGFISQRLTTGSGGGTTQLPGSGTPFV